ncbi:hypothetical protein [Candidatus Ichthyocystis hellenicum]|uniref:hypothetical protein n=1 Tax=Candidatus Ichthyocystis hellenicum TaxID=1561003 RepID=UPI000B84F1DF|nr:hypothetical protein [Candidatus Ichthyocystis hellenicum]
MNCDNFYLVSGDQVLKIQLLDSESDPALTQNSDQISTNLLSGDSVTDMRLLDDGSGSQPTLLQNNNQGHTNLLSGNQILDLQLLNDKLLFTLPKSTGQESTDQNLAEHAADHPLWENVPQTSNGLQSATAAEDNYCDQQPQHRLYDDRPEEKAQNTNLNGISGLGAYLVKQECSSSFTTNDGSVVEFPSMIQPNHHPWENVAHQECQNYQQSIHVDGCMVTTDPTPTYQGERLISSDGQLTATAGEFTNASSTEETSKNSSVNPSFMASGSLFSPYYGAKIDNDTIRKIGLIKKKLIEELVEKIKEATHRLKSHFSKSHTKKSPMRNMFSIVKSNSEEVYLNHLLNFTKNYTPDLEKTLRSAIVFDGKSVRSVLPEERYLIFCCFRRDNAIGTEKEIVKRVMSSFPELSNYDAECAPSKPSPKRVCTDSPAHTQRECVPTTEAESTPSIPKEDYVFSTHMIASSCISAIRKITDDLEKYEIDCPSVNIPNNVTKEDIVLAIGNCIYSFLKTNLDLDVINLSINAGAFCKIDRVDAFLISMLTNHKESNLTKLNGIWDKIFTPQVRDQLKEIMRLSLEKYEAAADNTSEILAGLDVIPELYAKALAKNPDVIIEEFIDVVKSDADIVRKFFFTKLYDNFFLSRMSAHKMNLAKGKIREAIITDKNLSYLFEVMVESCNGINNIEEVISRFSKDFLNLLEIICSQYTGKVYLILRSSPIIIVDKIIWLDAKKCMETATRFVSNIVNLKWIQIKESCRDRVQRGTQGSSS